MRGRARWMARAMVVAVAAGCGTGRRVRFVTPTEGVSIPGEVDVLGRFERATPVRFAGAAASGLVEHTFAPAGEDRDPDVCAGMLVFASTRHGERANLYLARTDGGPVAQLTNDPFDHIQPAFSPDGRRVAFASNRGGTWDLFVLTLDSGAVTQVTETDDHEVHPTWSPDGQRLAYSCLNTRTGRWEVLVTGLGRAGRRLVVTEGLFPVWSRTGRIAFQRARSDGSGWFSLWVVTVEGEQVGRPTEVVSGADWAAIAPAWSPEGDRLAFAAVNRDRLAPSSANVRYADSIWVSRADGTEAFRLTPPGEQASAPAWGDDGRVYFVSDRSGRRHVWSARPAPAPAIAPSASAAAWQASRRAEGPM